MVLRLLKLIKIASHTTKMTFWTFLCTWIPYLSKHLFSKCHDSTLWCSTCKRADSFWPFIVKGVGTLYRLTGVCRYINGISGHQRAFLSLLAKWFEFKAYVNIFHNVPLGARLPSVFNCNESENICPFAINFKMQQSSKGCEEETI